MGACTPVRPRLVSIAFVGSLTLVSPSTLKTAAEGTAQENEGLRRCLAIEADAPRLACFDLEVTKLVPPRFSGRLNKTTEPFEIDRPTRLRFQSDGAIFVLYLKSADGTVVQNLHIGGGGEATYVIETPGTYFLDVNGSESWRIWLETEARQLRN